MDDSVVPWWSNDIFNLKASFAAELLQMQPRPNIDTTVECGWWRPEAPDR
jgi:hypothetical protein